MTCLKQSGTPRATGTNVEMEKSVLIQISERSSLFDQNILTIIFFNDLLELLSICSLFLERMEFASEKCWHYLLKMCTVMKRFVFIILILEYSVYTGNDHM